MIITVTEQHLRECVGFQGTSLCPIDRALGKGFFVSQSHVVILLGKHAGESVPLANKAKKFIRKWEAKLPVEPFEFEIELPDLSREVRG